MHLRPWTLVVALVAPAACRCKSAYDLDDPYDQATDVATCTSGASGALTGGSLCASQESTGAPFDGTQWIGRYHYEMPFLPFGEHGDPMGPHRLANFEIFSDSTATMLVDECSFDGPEIIAYEWTSDEPGWLELYPGAGESSLRLVAFDDLETLRVQLMEPCRELAFELDGMIEPTIPFHPGESCWVDRCTTGNGLQVDYCDDEEPPPCP